MLRTFIQIEFKQSDENLMILAKDNNNYYAHKTR